MIVEDIYRIKITKQMIKEAQIDADFLKVKIGHKTRSDNSKRDIIGSLAHQAVEIAFQELNLPFQSSRKIKTIGGDNGDIFYDNNLIDVKGTASGKFDKWFYNKSFLVYTKEIDDIKSKGITDFIFVYLDREQMEAMIFGVISFNDFMELSKPLKLNNDNLEIKAYQLTPFTKYIYRI